MTKRRSGRPPAPRALGADEAARWLNHLLRAAAILQPFVNREEIPEFNDWPARWAELGEALRRWPGVAASVRAETQPLPQPLQDRDAALMMLYLRAREEEGLRGLARSCKVSPASLKAFERGKAGEHVRRSVRSYLRGDAEGGDGFLALTAHERQAASAGYNSVAEFDAALARLNEREAASEDE